MGEVVALKVRSGERSMLARYKEQVRRYGRELFSESWALESVPGGDNGVVVYRIMVREGSVARSMTDEMCLIDFVLFWDGFRLCADQMRA